jgi:hypothetical protein
MISEPVMLRCIANCFGNGASADWWHDRANMFADRLAARRQINALLVRQGYVASWRDFRRAPKVPSRTFA